MNAASPGLAEDSLVDLGGGAYPTLCFECHQMVLLPPEEAVLAEARAAMGVLTVVFCCGFCTRQAASRLADGGD